MSARWDADGDGGASGAGDQLLAVRAAEGDEEAFEVLVHRHGPVMLQLAERLLGNGAEAEDAVQDAFVSAWRKLPEFRGEAGFATWLHRIVTNRCLNLLRARRTTADLDTVPEPAAPEHQSSPVRAAESHAAADDLGRAMRALSAEQRVCWVLREIEGLPYESIASTVRISPEAVRARVFRARRVLTEAMAAWR
ncbi:sigma-70 family RNA polymerase sigma factor [Streptomyces sp. NPDC048606]|uniref:RNA polymerase sigma factor n=1 Tax=Streptomyces sp. NPDC048606 TaxID=3154726 RepID=UPI003437D905